MWIGLQAMKMVSRDLGALQTRGVFLDYESSLFDFWGNFF